MNEELLKFAKKRKLLKYSEEVIQYIFEGKDIPFDLWNKQRYPRSVNIYCEIECIVCKQKSRVSTKHLSKRTLVTENICLKCGRAEIYKRDGWVRANSEAQKKVQSTPEQKLKNSIAVTKFWKNNPDIRMQMSQTILKKYEDPEYKKMVAKARTKNHHALAGKYKLNNTKWVEFGSSYELCFLIWLENVKDITEVRKCKFYIEYRHEGRVRYYYPDYLIIRNEEKIIVEIKSKVPHFYDESKNAAKVKAAEKFIKTMDYNDYWFIDEEEAKDIGIEFKRSSRIKPLCKVLHKAGKIKLFSKEKELRYIGRVDEIKK